MTENQKAWLQVLFNDAIIEAGVAADNERTWADGAPDETSKALHLANAQENLGYVGILKTLRERTERWDGSDVLLKIHDAIHEYYRDPVTPEYGGTDPHHVVLKIDKILKDCDGLNCETGDGK